jgi:hypothetical protein
MSHAKLKRLANPEPSPPSRDSGTPQRFLYLRVILEILFPQFRVAFKMAIRSVRIENPLIIAMRRAEAVFP